jgi:hypothetical protein
MCSADVVPDPISSISRSSNTLWAWRAVTLLSAKPFEGVSGTMSKAVTLYVKLKMTGDEEPKQIAELKL